METIIERQERIGQTGRELSQLASRIERLPSETDRIDSKDFGLLLRYSEYRTICRFYGLRTEVQDEKVRNAVRVLRLKGNKFVYGELN